MYLDFEIKRVSVVANPSLGGFIYFVNGGVTNLPEIEYTNEHDFPIVITAQLTPEAKEYVGNTVFMIPTQYFLKPFETKQISFEMFRGYSPIATLFSKKGFDINVIEYYENSCPTISETHGNGIIQHVVNHHNVSSELTTSNSSEDKPRWWKKHSTPDEDEYADKYCGGDKRTKRYKAWIAAGKPIPQESIEEDDDNAADTVNNAE